jgi:hypothetical protein
MSNVLAIAATTRTLRNLLLARMPVLDSDLADLEVTLQAPDIARKGVGKAQLNLFLYQVVANAAWRNRDMPNQVRAGEVAVPPLALDLHYLITAYGRGDVDSDATSHRVLAAAMSTLHDRALLDGDDIRNALPDNDLADQVERVRITPLAQSVDELSKLWTAFQGGYRLSTAYAASVVLIDSQTPVRAALPVLARGQGDRGVIALAGTPPPVDGLRYPGQQAAARLGQAVELLGARMQAGALASFSSPWLADPVVVPTQAAGAGGVQVVLVDEPAALARWACGLYRVALASRPPGWPADHAPLTGTGVPFALAPTITVAPLAVPAGDLTLTITCAPRLVAGQRVFLVFNGTTFAPASADTPADATEPSTLVFHVPAVAAGTYPVRLRVDGVDSLPVDPAHPAVGFAADQTVVVA